MSMIDVLGVVSVISHVSSMKRTVTISNARYPMHSYLLYIPFGCHLCVCGPVLFAIT
jgi:hypothetical protein